MMYVKVHRSLRKVVAICDVSLMGKRFEEGKRQLDIRETFFKGEEHTYNEVVKLMQLHAKDDATFNIVGPESIKAALEAKLITSDSIAHVQKVPFTLILQ